MTGAVARHDAAVARVMATHLAARVPQQIRRRRIVLLQGEARHPRSSVVRPHRRCASQWRRSRGSGQQSPGIIACKDWIQGNNKSVGERIGDCWGGLVRKVEVYI